MARTVTNPVNLILTLILAAGLLQSGVSCSLGDPGTVDTGEPDPDPDPDDDDGTNPNAEPPAEGDATVHSILNGSFVPLEGFEAKEIDGRVQMTRFLDGKTQVDLVVTGLDPELEHALHLHALPCAFAGGGHYKIDPTILETIEENEIWPFVVTDANGVGRTSIVAEHMTRGDAMSVVIHAGPGEKMACADLLANDDGVFLGAGTIAPLPGAELIDQTIAGSATLTTTGVSTRIDMSISGLDPASEYRSHVHELPCEVNLAGGHYKIDPLAPILDPPDPVLLEANELWPVIGEHLNGTATVVFTKAHNSRYDAQSVVIHRVVDLLAPKVACVNLVRAKYPAGSTSGSAILLDAGLERLANLTATAELSRRLDGVSVAQMSATGLEVDGKYDVHVHNLPCGVSAGGGHYAEDSTIDGAEEDNELWLRLTAGADNAATAINFTSHVVRAEATSLVIHDPNDGARLACIDLN